MTTEHIRKPMRRRSPQRTNATLICPPDAAGRSWKVRLLGYLCRVPVMLCLVAGLGTMLHSALFPEYESAAFYPSLLLVSLLALICYGRWYTTLVGVGLSAACVAWHWLQQGDVLQHCNHILRVGAYGILQRLYNAGYYGYKQYQPQLTSYEQWQYAALVREFVALLCLGIALLLVPFLARRIRLIVPLVTSVALIVPVFTFNLPVSNWSVTGIIAGGCALLIMWVYQRCYDAKTDQERDSELFSDWRRPELPEQMREKAARKKEKKREKAEYRDRVRARRATGLVTVEEEINDYLSPSFATKAKKRSSRRNAEDESAAAEKERRNREKAQYRAVVNYDRVTGETRCAMGGIAGFFVMLLILVIMLLPTAAVDAPFGTIASIEHRVQSYRNYVTAVLRGNDAVLEMYTYGEQMRNEEPHTTTAETQEYDHVSLMRLYTQFNAPVYLQSWVGVNYTDGAWSSANDEQLYRWRSLYGTSDLPAETMFENFYQLMRITESPEDVSLDDLKHRYYGYDKYGYVMYMIHIRRLRSLGSELYLPRVSSSSLGILDDDTTAPVTDPWAVYFDGVAVSSLIDKASKSIATEAYVPFQNDPTWYRNVSKLIAAYNASAAEISRYETFHNKNSFIPNYQNTFVEIGNTNYYSPAQAYIKKMDDFEKEETLSVLKDADRYADFVYQTYLDTAESDIISALANKLYSETYADESYITRINEETGLLERVGIRPWAEPLSFALAAMRDSTLADTYAQRHLLTMAVINYLVENHEYSLEITTEGQEGLDGVENFLTVTKQGYCVQFASAAALLLRELGIPVRYMEGYLCTDYTRHIGVQEEYRFSGDVMDSDKHAWIEVWFDGIGWVIYETTPAYYIDLYGSTSITAGTLQPAADDGNTPVTPPTTPPEEPPIEPLVPLPPATNVPVGRPAGGWIKGILAGVAIAAAGAAVVVGIVWFIRRGKRAQWERDRFAKQIMARDPSIFDTEAHRAAAAKRLIRHTWRLLALYGSSPHPGELRDAYAERLSFDYEDAFGSPAEHGKEMSQQRERTGRVCIDSLMEAVAAEEFGHGMTPENMADLAHFYLSLHRLCHTRVTAPKRWILRYVKREI